MVMIPPRGKALLRRTLLVKACIPRKATRGLRQRWCRHRRRNLPKYRQRIPPFRSVSTCVPLMVSTAPFALVGLQTVVACRLRKNWSTENRRPASRMQDAPALWSSSETALVTWKDGTSARTRVPNLGGPNGAKDWFRRLP